VAGEEVVEQYLSLGLEIGRHVDGFVDSYYGPRELAERAAVGPAMDPHALVERARALVARISSESDLEASRRRWLGSQARGLHTSARKLAGETIAYLDEIESCYGVRPTFVAEDEFADAHRRLQRGLPGSGDLRDRYISWREAQVVPPECLGAAIGSLAEDFRERTAEAFGLPEGEGVDFELVSDQPWSGFNYYLGDLRSRVAINTDLPVLSLVLGHLVAHEAYPGHHTEHSRKEAGLVRRDRQLEETIALVGTPQCLVGEGLADLGLEVIAGARPEPVLAGHLKPFGIPYDDEVAASVAEAGELLGSVRGNAAILVHDRGWGVDEAISYIEKWSLTTRARATKAMQFLMDPVWRAYPFCYIDGVRICRQYVAGQPNRFRRLITEQLLPADLVAA
jgi:hypothetical protein